MSDQNLLTRREFTVEWVLAVLAGATITITGCGGDDNNSNGVTNPTPQAGDKAGVISANHDHTVTVTAAQITAGNAVTATLTTGNGHTHTISLTAAQVVSIGQNQRVSGTSSTEAGHNHDVTFN
jgi:hypothetical protein